jgi:hypothetical protein
MPLCIPAELPGMGLGRVETQGHCRPISAGSPLGPPDALPTIFELSMARFAESPFQLGERFKVVIETASCQLSCAGVLRRRGWGRMQAGLSITPSYRRGAARPRPASTLLHVRSELRHAVIKARNFVNLAEPTLNGTPEQ